ncbi:hypothetical protein MUN89_17135 [Halobacillus salinarum]|uniref:Uncharacterized protein n=1 Tax=Halobacillus salinarum TaxID=2932257 RepID=A0ABY4EGL4_9BACI|nr:hypothetical protein [Halobacillus salinarum]UOQ43613.1 hypothetical protein MUN89_17135 [Halobacillus salinarum]
MTIFVELLDGSYDLLFLSIYLSLLMTIAVQTIWSHMVHEPSGCLSTRQVIADTRNIEVKERRYVVLPDNEMVQWLQRTVRRKEDSSDDDHCLYI